MDYRDTRMDEERLVELESSLVEDGQLSHSDLDDLFHDAAVGVHLSGYVEAIQQALASRGLEAVDVTTEDSGRTKVRLIEVDGP